MRGSGWWSGSRGTGCYGVGLAGGSAHARADGDREALRISARRSPGTHNSPKTVDTVHVGSRQHLIIAVGRQRPAVTGPAESCGIEISATDRSRVPDGFGSCPYG
jgi:hypothetical protein